MRFMLQVRANRDSEAGIMPSKELVAAMGKFNEEMTKAGAARVIVETELNVERLVKEIFNLLEHPEETESLASKARGMAYPHAAREIVNLIEEVAKVGGAISPLIPVAGDTVT